MRALLLFTLCLLIPRMVVGDSSLPDLGDQTAAISRNDEYRLGRAYERAFRGSVPTLSDPLVQDYIEHLIYRLAFNTPLPTPDLSIVLIDSTDINAFAVPGGFVGLNAGVFLYTRSEAELASVLAHELGHLKQRHYARMMADSAHDMWWYLAAMAAAIAFGSKGTGDAGMGAIAATQAALAQHQLHYSRQYEQEADRIGLQTLVNAHIDPNAMPRFFQRLLDATSGGINIPAYLQDHPVTSSRIADTAARAAQFHVHYPDDSLEYELIRASVVAYYTSDVKAALIPLRATIARGGQDQDSILARYTAANLLMNTNHPQEAEPLIRSLIVNDPHRIAYVYTLGEILLSEKKYDAALHLLNDELADSPTSVPLMLLDAQALTDTHQPKAAIALTQGLLEDRPDDTDVWQTLADAYAADNDALDLYRARAELYYLNGDDRHALEQMHLGLQAAGTNYPARARFENRLQQMNQGHQDLKN